MILFLFQIKMRSAQLAYEFIPGESIDECLRLLFPEAAARRLCKSRDFVAHTTSSSRSSNSCFLSRAFCEWELRRRQQEPRPVVVKWITSTAVRSIPVCVCVSGLPFKAHLTNSQYKVCMRFSFMPFANQMLPG